MKIQLIISLIILQIINVTGNEIEYIEKWNCIDLEDERNVEVGFDEKSLTIKANNETGRICDCWTPIETNQFDKKQITSITFAEGITRIGSSCFSPFINLETVSFPSTLEEIGKGAFFNTKIKEIEIPNSLKSIEEHAFEGNKELTTITFEDEEESQLEHIGENAFRGCVELTEFYIPKNVKEFSRGIIGGCDKITPIEVSSENPVYLSSDNIIYDKEKKTIWYYSRERKDEIVDIENSVETIGRMSFLQSQMKKIVFPEDLKEIE